MYMASFFLAVRFILCYNGVSPFPEVIVKRFAKIYLEISNICNLHCSFCPGTKRAPRALDIEHFSTLLEKLKPYTDYLYFHLMGEPLCHPNLGDFLKIAHQEGFKVIITTNGTLLQKRQEVLMAAPPYKTVISLHAFEANDLALPFSEYLRSCFEFGQAMHDQGLVIYRLWNHGGADVRNSEILSVMKEYFPMPWAIDRRGHKLRDKVYVEYGNKFDWPEMTAEAGGDHIFCYALRDQIGVLCDGTVVPCCLDHDGDLALGNLFEQELEEILNSPRAKMIYDGFSERSAVEELCRRCGYARRFN